VAEYVLEDMTVWPAGVAYTHPTMGYQTVNIGFGVECMIGDLRPNGHYTTGAYDRVDFMANIMEYFGETPTGPGTGAENDGLFVTGLAHARPNPFNPMTTEWRDDPGVRRGGQDGADAGRRSRRGGTADGDLGRHDRLR
jgi:hypothetical protein